MNVTEKYERIGALDKPTVGDVIRFLQQFPQDTPFRMLDADTEWTIQKVHTYTEGGCLWFKGEYNDMVSDLTEGW